MSQTKLIISPNNSLFHTEHPPTTISSSFVPVQPGSSITTCPAWGLEVIHAVPGSSFNSSLIYYIYFPTSPFFYFLLYALIKKLMTDLTSLLFINFIKLSVDYVLSPNNSTKKAVYSLAVAALLPHFQACSPNCLCLLALPQAKWHRNAPCSLLHSAHGGLDLAICFDGLALLSFCPSLFML